jgi:redox-sensitive bicupin YhaK (pirin superfamily)
VLAWRAGHCRAAALTAIVARSSRGVRVSPLQHAEGGGSPAGMVEEGFQLWVNVPAARKSDDPRYGTEPPERLPVIEAAGVLGRVIAGDVEGRVGPVGTVQSVQIVDYELSAGASYTHTIGATHNTCMVSAPLMCSPRPSVHEVR